MYAFSYWHTYHDSAFLQYPIRVIPSLFHELNIYEDRIEKWPHLQRLPQLIKVYQILENFIIEESNWGPCICSEQEMNEMEDKLNHLLIILQLQKKYGIQFWNLDYRRIQASSIHFFIILSHFIYTIIPKDQSCLFDAQKSHKLSLKIEKLQQFFNVIIKYINPVYAYLKQSIFEQEKQLIKQYLIWISQFIKKLPKVEKEKLIQVPKIMQYICIVNPIEVTKQMNGGKYQIPQQNRKKTMTMDMGSRTFKRINSEGKRQKNKSKDKIVDKQIHNSIEKVSNNQYKMTFKELSERIRYFKFKKIKPLSIKKKSPTLTSMDTKQKTSPGKDASFMSSSMVLKTSPRKNTDFRSRQITNRSFMSKKSKESNKKLLKVMVDEFEYERDAKAKKKSSTQAKTCIKLYSNHIDVVKGQSRGWDRIRQYVFERVAQRKLRRILKC